MHIDGSLSIRILLTVEFLSVLYFMILNKTVYFISDLIFTYFLRVKRLTKLILLLHFLVESERAWLVPTATSTGEFSTRLKTETDMFAGLKFSKYFLQWRKTMFLWHQTLWKGMLIWTVQNKVCSFLQYMKLEMSISRLSDKTWRNIFSKQSPMIKLKVNVKVTLSCLTLCNHMDCSPWNSPGQNTGVGRLSLLQGIFPIQGLNPGLLGKS